MLSRRQLVAQSSLIALFGASALRPATGWAAQGSDVTEILDGEAPIDATALAALARDRIQLGIGWLYEMLRPTGVFYYIYDPTEDVVETRAYNDVRHAGTTYAIFQAYGLFKDETSSSVGEAAADYIQQSTVPVRAAGRAYLDIQNGDTSLGGQALALVALLERRRATGETDADDLIHEMASFLLWLEKDDRSGIFYNSFDHRSRTKLETPDVVYYPGEALLALTRLAAHFPEETVYRQTARRLARYLVRKRDGDLVKLEKQPREDHWLTIALSDLYRLDQQEVYADVVFLQAESMIANQYTAENDEPALIGGARADGPVSNTSTATKGEALVAAWALAVQLDDQERIDQMTESTARNAQYQMRVQYVADNVGEFPRPEGALGGWPANSDDPSIRIDYVQHNLSVLIGLVHMVEDGDIPRIGLPES